LAFDQFGGVVKHERNSSAMEGKMIKRCPRFLYQSV
jgi:hypothetical protein